MKKGIITIGLSALICFASVLVYIKNGFANEKKEVEVAVLHTQETGFTDSGESLYTEIGEYGKNGLAKVKKDGKYGLINELGVVLAQTVYDEMGEFGTNGLILVRQGRRYNFLNSFGMCEFETVGEFSEGGVAPAKRDGKYYFIDKRGNRVNDRTYDSVFVMDKGKMYKVRCGTKYGAVNGKGEEVIPAVYDGMYPTTYEGGIGIMSKLLRVEVWKDVYAYIIWNGTSYGAADENGKLLCDVKYKNIIGINKENQIIIVENEDGIREWRNLDNELVRELGENGWLSYGVIIISEEGKPTTYYNTSLNSVIEHEYEWSRAYDDFFIFEQENGKYGVMDYEKNIIAEPIYDFLEYVTDEEYFIVTYNGKNGYYTKDMQEIIPCQFDYAEFFRDNGLALVKIDGKEFLINKNGQIVIPPIYDDISMGLGDEYIEVKKGEKWDLINKKGEVCLDFIYDSIIVGLISFEGEEYIQVWDYDKGCGLFNKNLEMLLPVEYKEIEHSEEYECIYAVDQYNVRHYFDKNGKELFPVDYYAGELSDDGLIAVASEKGNLIYDAYGTLVDSLAYTVWGEFSHGLITASNEEGMVGYLNENGDVAIDFQFEEAEAFSEDGIAAVRKDGKWGFIDEAGRVVAECMYDDVGKFSQGRAAVCREGKWGFIDCLGEEIIPLQFESVEDFSFTEAIVTVSGANEEDRNVINYVGEIIR